MFLVEETLLNSYWTALATIESNLFLLEIGCDCIIDLFVAGLFSHQLICHFNTWTQTGGKEGNPRPYCMDEYYYHGMKKG